MRLKSAQKGNQARECLGLGDGWRRLLPATIQWCIIEVSAGGRTLLAWVWEVKTCESSHGSCKAALQWPLNSVCAFWLCSCNWFAQGSKARFQSCCHCTGTRLLRLRLAEPVLAARMGAPATVNIITPHALLALPLHPPRLVKTLHQLGLLSPLDSLQSNTHQAAATTSHPGAAILSPFALMPHDAVHLDCWTLARS